MGSEVVLTRAGQITLTKDVRERLEIKEGDVLVVNTVGNQAIVTKRDPRVFKEFTPFLPKNFEEILKKIRRPAEARLQRLGILP